MKQPFELDPVITVGDFGDGGLTPEGFPHKHAWLFGTVLPHQRKHVITEQPMTMLSLLMTCICGAQRHSWMAPPPEPQADQQRAVVGGDLSSLAGKPS